MMENEKKFLRSKDYDNILKSIEVEYENPLGLLKAIYDNQKEINPEFMRLMTNAIDRAQSIVITKYLHVEPFSLLYQSPEYKFYESLKTYLLELENLLKVNTESDIKANDLKNSSLKPIEKILIYHYLNHQAPPNLQWKEGIYFISNLLGINPDSIKSPLAKIEEYTKGTPTKQQCIQRLRVLRNVKQFFDNSGMRNYADLVEKRINELSLISGEY